MVTKSSDSTIDPVAARLRWGFGGLAAEIFLLLVFGSTVRVHGAGLACPDWPLCFGEVVPQMNFEVFLEWGHRVLASVVSLVFVGLSVATLRRPALRARTAGWFVLGYAVLALQVVLGGLTVLHLLAYWSVTLHLLAGNLFLAVVLSIRARLGEPSRRPVAPALRWLVPAAALAWFVQMGLGGLVASNYAGTACSEWPTCNGGVWFPTWSGPIGLQLLHRLGAYGLTALVVAAAIVGRRDPLGGRWLVGAAALVLVQIGVGVANVYLGLPVELAVLHAAVADAIGVALVVAAWAVVPRPVVAQAPVAVAPVAPGLERA